MHACMDLGQSYDCYIWYVWDSDRLQQQKVELLDDAAWVQMQLRTSQWVCRSFSYSYEFLRIRFYHWQSLQSPGRSIQAHRLVCSIGVCYLGFFALQSCSHDRYVCNSLLHSKFYINDSWTIMNNGTLMKGRNNAIAADNCWDHVACIQVLLKELLCERRCRRWSNQHESTNRLAEKWLVIWIRWTLMSYLTRVPDIK